LFLGIVKGETGMTAYNIVRFRVKPDCEEAFVASLGADLRAGLPGLLGGALVRTGEREFCEIGRWESFGHMVEARPAMIRSLDAVRDMLEELEGGSGVTDPRSGEAAIDAWDLGVKA
jgi:hypothetical protein